MHFKGDLKIIVKSSKANKERSEATPKDFMLGSSGQACITAGADTRHGHCVVQCPATSSTAAHLKGSIQARCPRTARFPTAHTAPEPRVY